MTMSADKKAEAVLIGGKVGRNPVEDNAEAGLVAGVYQGHELFGRAKAAGEQVRGPDGFDGLLPGPLAGLVKALGVEVVIAHPKRPVPP